MTGRRVAFAHRGSTAHLLPFFAGSLLLATVIDVIAAVGGMAAQPDDNTDAALTLVTTFSKPGLLAFVFIGVLIFAYCRSRKVDAQQVLVNREQSEPTRATPAGLIGAWIAVVGGSIMVVLAVWFCTLLWIDAHNLEFSDKPSDLMINLIVGGVTLAGVLLAAIPVWLGILTLRQRPWARYALIGYSAVAAVAIHFWPLLQREPLIEWAAIAVPVLLLWSELRTRGLAGSFRGCWRGMVMLVFNGHVVAVFVLLEAGYGADDGALGLALMSLVLPAWLLVTLLLAIWAINNDRNQLWAGINAVVVVAGPVLISLVGLGATIVEIIGQLPG